MALLCSLGPKQGIDPLGPTAAQIAPFLYSLFDTRGMLPQTVQGYRSCLASVPNRTGNTAVINDKAISDTITSVELQRPRIIQVLPQWDLGIVREALSKPPYGPLREASLKRLTLKTVFLLTKASAGRPGELQAFDLKYIQFKPKGAGLLFISAPFSCEKYQRRSGQRPWVYFNNPYWQVRFWCY